MYTKEEFHNNVLPRAADNQPPRILNELRQLSCRLVASGIAKGLLKAEDLPEIRKTLIARFEVYGCMCVWACVDACVVMCSRVLFCFFSWHVCRKAAMDSTRKFNPKRRPVCRDTPRAVTWSRHAKSRLDVCSMFRASPLVCRV